MTRVVILGGTADANALAAALYDAPGIALTTTLAGRVANPKLPMGDVRIGGFGGAIGLAAYLRAERVDAVIDATHPFAARMSRNAFVACADTGVALLALDRPRWTEEVGDTWLRVPDEATAAHLAYERGRRIFLTIGRQGLAPYAAMEDRWFLIRTIDPPEPPLPARHRIVLARGPFAQAEEVSTMREHAIDLVVAKDSGGAMTVAKLAAARALQLPVVVIERPAPSGARTVASREEVLAWLATVAR